MCDMCGVMCERREAREFERVCSGPPNASASARAVAPTSPTSPERVSACRAQPSALRPFAQAIAHVLPALVPPRCSARSVEGGSESVGGLSSAVHSCAAWQSPSPGLRERSISSSCGSVRSAVPSRAGRSSAATTVGSGGGAWILVGDGERAPALSEKLLLSRASPLIARRELEGSTAAVASASRAPTLRAHLRVEGEG